MWPDVLNPCPFQGRHGDRPMRTASYWCHGRVTQLCSNCVFERKAEFGNDAIAALETFNPDPEGNECSI